VDPEEIARCVRDVVADSGCLDADWPTRESDLGQLDAVALALKQADSAAAACDSDDSSRSVLSAASTATCSSRFSRPAHSTSGGELFSLTGDCTATTGSDAAAGSWLAVASGRDVAGARTLSGRGRSTGHGAPCAQCGCGNLKSPVPCGPATPARLDAQ
jgi:hypothetical protein